MRIVDLRDAGEEAMAGGKAKALGYLLRASTEVPPGFVVVGAHVPLGDEQKNALLRQFDSLGATYVAVRSSAASEDGTADAWAGQLDTYLNVPRRLLVQRVQDCVQSARSERAQAYAAQKNIAAGDVAVVVQAMVDSEVSGVAFSVHPVTKSTEQMVLEAGLGLGEAIVSGAITPDTYIVEATSGAVTDSFLSTQNKQLVRGPDGDAVWQTIDPPGSKAKLEPEQITELAKTVRAIAEHYGYPVDIEWAFASGTLYILQARPITTL